MCMDGAASPSLRECLCKALLAHEDVGGDEVQHRLAAGRLAHAAGIEVLVGDRDTTGQRGADGRVAGGGARRDVREPAAAG
jgi:hypothetical protein